MLQRWLTGENDAHIEDMGGQFETLTDDEFELYSQYRELCAKLTDAQDEPTLELCRDVEQLSNDVRTHNIELGSDMRSGDPRALFNAFLANKVGGISLKCQAWQRKQRAAA